jgi:hypothetical protein
MCESSTPTKKGSGGDLPDEVLNVIGASALARVHAQEDGNTRTTPPSVKASKDTKHLTS